MIYHCLEKKSVEKLVFRTLGIDQEEDDISDLFQGAASWDHCLISASYFLAKVIQKLLKDQKGDERAIEQFYTIVEEGEMFVQIEEFDLEFVETLVRSYPFYASSVDDIVVKIMDRRYDYDFGNVRG